MLVTAAKEGHLRVVTSLLAAHAWIDGIWSDLSPIAVAASEGHTEVVRLLLKRGAALDAQESDHTVTALLAASRNGPLGDSTAAARSFSRREWPR